MPSLPKDQLRRVRDKVATGWIQGKFARDANGDPIWPQDPQATCWCIFGAAEAVATDEILLANTLGFADTRDMVAWNDTPGRTQEQVLERIDNALERD